MGKILTFTGKIVAMAALCAVSLAACGNHEGNSAVSEAEGRIGGDRLAPPPGWTVGAGAAFIDREGAEAGRALLFDVPSGGVLIRLDLAGLAQGWRAVRLHEVGDCGDFADGFLAAGDPINPDGFGHGLLNLDGPARADLPNIHAGADGRAAAELFNARVALAAGEAALAVGAHPVLDEDGFAIVVYERASDHLTPPTGGARVACAAVKGR